MSLTMEDSLVQQTHILNESGQSAIEFILTIAFAFGITFLFVGHSLNITSGYLAHYVNFMAARTYLTVDDGSDNFLSTSNAAFREANSVIDRFPLEAFGVKPEVESHNYQNASAIFTGITMYFEKKVSLMPIVGGTEKGRFLSESFLGKEPTVSTCLEMTCQALSGDRNACKDALSKSVTLYDNGC